MKEKSFKECCNKIVDLIKINRKFHHQKYFEENKRNSKAIWQQIHNIIYSNKRNRIYIPSSLFTEENTIHLHPGHFRTLQQCFYVNRSRSTKKYFSSQKALFELSKGFQHRYI